MLGMLGMLGMIGKLGMLGMLGMIGTSVSGEDEKVSHQVHQGNSRRDVVVRVRYVDGVVLRVPDDCGR